MKKTNINICFSRNALKGLAAVSMVIDHIAFVFLSEQDTYHILYLGMRIFGRIAFPLFCFFLVQGFIDTNNLNYYFFRLFLFACISEIPFDLFIYHRMISFRGQNCMFTLFISLIVLYGISKVSDSKISIFILILCGSCLAIILKTDYSYLGVLLTSVMYIWKEEPLNLFLILCVVMGVQGGLNPWEIIALPFILLYHPKKKNAPLTQKKPAFQRYFFYWFYPAHMLCLFLFDVYF